MSKSVVLTNESGESLYPVTTTDSVYGENGTKTLNDILRDKQPNITETNKLSSNLISDTDSANMFMTQAEKTKLSGIEDGANKVTKTSQLTNDSGFMTGYTETDPTVPSWAKQATKPTYTASEVGALSDYTLTINHGTAGNPRMVKFTSVNYTTSATCFKMGAMTCHDNGVSYQFLTDMLIAVTAAGEVTANIYKFAQQPVGSVDGVARYTGDVFYVNDTTNKIVDFYILCGQYSSSQFTPVTKVGSTTIDYVTQYSGTATYYSSGDKVWVNGCGSTYARTSDIPSKVAASNPNVFIGYISEENKNSDFQVAFKNNDQNNGICWSRFANRGDEAKAPSLCDYNGFFYVSSSVNSLSGADANPFLQYHASNNDFRILTTAYNDQWLQQIATDFRTEHIYTRRKENGTWTNWSKVAHTLTAFPIGAIYMSTVNTNPASFLGGSWTQIKGRFLLGAGANDANTDTTYGSLAASAINRGVKEKGGEVYHTLTVNEMPAHTHSSVAKVNTSWKASSSSSTSGNLASAASTASTGGGAAHNNMPPYYAVYMWERVG